MKEKKIKKKLKHLCAGLDCMSNIITDDFIDRQKDASERKKQRETPVVITPTVNVHVYLHTMGVTAQVVENNPLTTSTEAKPEVFAEVIRNGHTDNKRFNLQAIGEQPAEMSK